MARRRLGTVVVVGASLAGLRAAETLRQEGFDGRIVLVGAEDHLPYDRPPLSKQLLAGTWTPERLHLRDPQRWGELDLDSRLGRTAVALDVEGRTVDLDDGETLGFDGLVLATGARPRVPPGLAPLPGVHTLRTIEDCVAISAAVARPGARVAVVGAGFIGAEVAATCHGRGAEVTVLEALPTPLARVLGVAMGEVCGALHRHEGVDLRCGVGVAAFEGDGRLERVRLADGDAVEADLAVLGVGVVPATEWLESSSLSVDDGVICDEACFAAPDVVAAGDVARWPNRLFGVSMRVEHWTNAAEQGAAAARNLLIGPEDAEPFCPVPYFWSDQYGVKIQYVGHASPDDEVAVVEGSVEDRRFVAAYGRAGRLTAALAFDRPRPLMAFRRLLADRATWEDALAQGAV
ncbi:MAG: NAD(P)/FAD-dependent oxidoreductase [Acidimicrobiales bacterium]